MNTNKKYCICIADMNHGDDTTFIGDVESLSPDCCHDSREYTLPVGIGNDVVVNYGRGLLFMADWSAVDTMTNVWEWCESENRWILLD